ncbi:MAG: sensor histidine kinase, partial [Thermodesulfobacteriota bacterium]
ESETYPLDAEQLQTDLVNILENAVHTCTEDLSKAEHTIRFRVRRSAEGLVFEIEDDGTGMDARTREKIFTLFFSSKSTQGTGIGLFVTQNIIRQHGGNIQVTSELGRGTRFSVTIPGRSPDSEAQPERPSDSETD